MGPSTSEALRAQHALLNELYDANRDAVAHLQATLLHDILPGLADELGTDPAAAADWLHDTPTIFRTLKRQAFTASLALDALQNTLAWRVRVLPRRAAPAAGLVLLAHPCADPCGRPLLAVRLAELLRGRDVRGGLVHAAERMRMHLVQLNEARPGVRPLLQFVALLDVEGVSVGSMQSVDILGWLVQELLPRFPGLLGAVFVVNYTWAHAGLWRLARTLLPPSALQKIFFVSHTELTSVFTPARLPQDWGGALPPTNALHSPASSLPSPPPTPSPAPEPTPEQQLTRTPISSTSLLNPFFGYPAVAHPASAPAPAHGRRRRRDLLRTLARLWWARWRGAFGWGALLGMLLVLLRRVLLRQRSRQR